MSEFRFDLHVHSLYSSDCKSHPNDIIKMAKKMKMAGIALTDHNTVDFHLSKIDGEGLGTMYYPKGKFLNSIDDLKEYLERILKKEEEKTK